MWTEIFNERWPSIKEWFLAEGDAARPSFAVSVRMIREHMPELLAPYERLVELAGGGDLEARMLAQFQPPSLLGACSQGVWTQGGGPLLVRNYDYWPSRLDGVVFRSRMTERSVIGMSDGLWGLLDGMNENGLSASLTFGGRNATGAKAGFGISLIIRYVLETCETALEARTQLSRLPCAHAHNVTIVDRDGDVLTAYLGADREPAFRRFQVTTNHQEALAWAGQELMTRTLEREGQILALLDSPALTATGFADSFLVPPLYEPMGATGFGTVYTAVYQPNDRAIAYRWPSESWDLSFDTFRDGTRSIPLEASSPALGQSL